MLLIWTPLAPIRACSQGFYRAYGATASGEEGRFADHGHGFYIQGAHRDWSVLDGQMTTLLLHQGIARYKSCRGTVYATSCSMQRTRCCQWHKRDLYLII